MAKDYLLYQKSPHLFEWQLLLKQLKLVGVFFEILLTTVQNEASL